MTMRHSFIIVAFVATLISLAVFSVVYASNPADQPIYTVEQHPSGHLRVRVRVNLVDRAVRDRYAIQQRAKALALARSNIGKVPIQVTFARPLSIEDVGLLAESTGLAAELVIFEARDNSGTQHAVGTRGTGTEIADLDSLAPGLAAHHLHLVGVTALRGMVPGSRLEQLATHPEVYIPDVTPHQLAKDVAAQYGVSVDKVEVSIPTPHWYISAERR